MASINYDRKISFLTRLRYFFEAMGVFLLYGFFAILPVGVASWIGGKIARTLFPHFAASRKAIRNVALAMPELDEKAKKRIVVDMWENLGHVFAEYPHLHKLNDRIKMIGGEHMIAARDSDNGSIMVGGHFANWEVYAASANTLGLGLHLVYRKPNNIFVDGLLRRCRHKAGALSNITKTVEGARQMVGVLNRGETIGALIDQKFNEGVAVPFFGHDAMTAPAVAQLAVRMSIPLHPVRIRRTNGANFEVTVYPAMKIPSKGNRDEKAYKILCELHALFEEWIRQEPSQWLWLHRRWKLPHKPD